MAGFSSWANAYSASTSWTSGWTAAATISSADLVASATYLCIARGTARSTTPTDFRVLNDSVSVTVSEGTMDGRSTASGRQYHWCGEITTDASPGDVVLQINSAAAEDCAITLLRVDNLPAGSYYSNTNTTQDLDIGATYLKKAAVTVPDTAGHAWWIGGSTKITAASPSYQVYSQLTVGGTSIHSNPDDGWSVEPDDSSTPEVFNMSIFGKHTFSASAEVAIWVKEESAAAGNDYESSFVFAVDIQELFTTYSMVSASSSTAINPHSNWYEHATAAHTVGTTGDVLVLAWVLHDLASLNSQGQQRFQIDDDATLTGVSVQFMGNDNGDAGPSVMMNVYSLTASTLYDIDLDGNNSAATNLSTLYDGFILVLDLEEGAASGDATATPAAITATTTAPAATVTTGTTATPAAVAAVTALAAVTITLGTTTTPAAIAATTTVPAATVVVTEDATVTPAAIAATTTLPTPTIQTGTTATPAAVAATTTLPTPTILTGTNATATPAAIAAVTTLPAATIQTGTTATPAAITATVTLPAATITLGTSSTPAAIAATTTLPAVTVVVTEDATASPAAIAATTTLPATTVTLGTTTVQTAIAATTTLPTPTIDTDTGTTATPATIAATTKVGYLTDGYFNVDADDGGNTSHVKIADAGAGFNYAFEVELKADVQPDGANYGWIGGQSDKLDMWRTSGNTWIFGHRNYNGDTSSANLTKAVPAGTTRFKWLVTVAAEGGNTRIKQWMAFDDDDYEVSPDASVLKANPDTDIGIGFANQELYAGNLAVNAVPVDGNIYSLEIRRTSDQSMYLDLDPDTETTYSNTHTATLVAGATVTRDDKLRVLISETASPATIAAVAGFPTPRIKAQQLLRISLVGATATTTSHTATATTIEQGASNATYIEVNPT